MYQCKADDQKVEVSGGCQYITGEGLTPLQGSSVLEQIDISLVGKHRHPAIEPEPMISEAPILPILESIVLLQMAVH